MSDISNWSQQRTSQWHHSWLSHDELTLQWGMLQRWMSQWWYMAKDWMSQWSLSVMDVTTDVRAMHGTVMDVTAIMSQWWMSQQWCHSYGRHSNDVTVVDVTVMMSQLWMSQQWCHSDGCHSNGCHSNDVTAWCHSNDVTVMDVTAMMSQQWCDSDECQIGRCHNNECYGDDNPKSLSWWVSLWWIWLFLYLFYWCFFLRFEKRGKKYNAITPSSLTIHLTTVVSAWHKNNQESMGCIPTISTTAHCHTVDANYV